jgi:hypothetical protein
MATATLPEQSGVDLMQAFIATHGEPPAVPDGDRSSPVPYRTETNQAPPDPEPDDSDPGLDEATLQALGLVPEKPAEKPADAPNAEDDGASEGRQVDLAALAEALGLSSEDLSHDGKTLKLKAKVDGEVFEVSLAELRKGYQLQSHFTKQQDGFLAERQQWEQARATQEAQFKQAAEMVNGLLSREEETLNREYTRDWEALRQQDPAEYAAQVADYNRKLAEVRNRRTAVEQEIGQRMQAQEREYSERMQKHLSEEQARLSDALGWKDEAAKQAGGQKLQEYLFTKVGMTPQQLSSILDHRAFVLYDKARRYDELVSKIATAKKRVAEAPAVLPEREVPPAAPVARQRAKEDAMKRHRTEHSVESAAQVFRQLKVV